MDGSDLRRYWDGSSADEMRDPPDGRSASEESETGKRQKPVPHLPALNQAQPYRQAACYCIRCFTESPGHLSCKTQRQKGKPITTKYHEGLAFLREPSWPW